LCCPWNGASARVEHAINVENEGIDVGEPALVSRIPRVKHLQKVKN